MRPEKSRYSVYLTGINAPDIAAHMRRLEPALDIELGGDGSRAELGAYALRYIKHTRLFFDVSLYLK